jgi:hypothetical protein
VRDTPEVPRIFGPRIMRFSPILFALVGPLFCNTFKVSFRRFVRLADRHSERSDWPPHLRTDHLFCYPQLQRTDVHRRFGYNILQLPVLLLQLAQPLRRAQFQPTELTLPPIKTRPRDPVLPAQLPGFHPCF